MDSMKEIFDSMLSMLLDMYKQDRLSQMEEEELRNLLITYKVFYEDDFWEDCGHFE